MIPKWDLKQHEISLASKMGEGSSMGKNTNLQRHQENGTVGEPYEQSAAAVRQGCTDEWQEMKPESR